MLQGRKAKVFSEIGQWLDDFRATTRALKVTEGLNDEDRTRREIVLNGLADLMNMATVHLIRAQEDDYKAADKAAVLSTLTVSVDFVRRQMGRGLPTAIDQLAVRAQTLVDAMLELPELSISQDIQDDEHSASFGHFAAMKNAAVA